MGGWVLIFHMTGNECTADIPSPHFPIHTTTLIHSLTPPHKATPAVYLLHPHELVIVVEDLVEEMPDGGVVGQHQPTHAMGGLDIGGLLRQGDLIGQ